MKKALLLSGGMDSISIAYWLMPDVALTIDYGHLPAAGEVRASAAVCKELNIQHEIVSIDLREYGSGHLAGKSALDMAPVPEWWPFRNQMLVSIAAMWGISRQVTTLIVGSLISDGQHADGRIEFFEAMNALLAVQEGGLRVETPSIDLTAEQLVKTSGVPIEILSWAHSCHAAEHACGMCRGCLKHFSTWAKLGLEPY